MPPLRTACALAAVPTAVLLALGVTGQLAWIPALFSMAAIAAGAVSLAQFWRQDTDRLIQALQDGAGHGLATGQTLALRLSAAAPLAQEAARLSRSLSSRQSDLEAVIEAERALFRRLPDPLIILAPNYVIRRVNAAAEAAFGADLAAVLRHPGLRGAIDRAQAENRTQATEISLPVPVSREVFATVIPLAGTLADGGRIVTVLSDRTRERAVERMRADFVANASHELRTPLASLIGFIDTLRGPAADDPAAQARFLGIMAEQAQRMNRLIDDLLSLSRVELTEHQTPADPVSVTELIDRMADLFEPQIARRRIRLDIDAPSRLLTVLGDEGQLEQVLQNLLDNAVKYGREGGRIQIAAREAPPGPPWPPRAGVALSVSDDGQGIARAHIPRLTERFYRADKHRSRAVGGTGLGLAIVKHIVNRHRGQLTIDSTEGAGATVTVWLPAAPLPAAARSGEAEAENGAATRA